MHLEVAAVKVEVVQPHLRQRAAGPRRELALELLADPGHRGPRQRRLRAQHLGQRGLDVTIRQAPHPAGDDQRFQRVGPGHAQPEQPRAEPLVGAAQLRPLHRDRAHGGLDRRRRLPAVARTRPTLDGRLVALVAGSAQELSHLGLRGGLHHQTAAEAAHLLKDRGQVTVGGEQRIDLSADALGRGYSWCHGCRSSFVLSQVRGNLRPLHVYTRDETPPPPTIRHYSPTVVLVPTAVGCCPSAAERRQETSVPVPAIAA